METGPLAQVLVSYAQGHPAVKPLVDTLICCDLAGRRPEAVVLGMEPEDCTTMNTELTPRIAERLPRFCEAALEEPRHQGVEVFPPPAAG